MKITGIDQYITHIYICNTREHTRGLKSSKLKHYPRNSHLKLRFCTERKTWRHKSFRFCFFRRFFFVHLAAYIDCRIEFEILNANLIVWFVSIHMCDLLDVCTAGCVCVCAVAVCNDHTNRIRMNIIWNVKNVFSQPSHIQDHGELQLDVLNEWI